MSCSRSDHIHIVRRRQRTQTRDFVTVLTYPEERSHRSGIRQQRCGRNTCVSINPRSAVHTRSITGGRTDAGQLRIKEAMHLIRFDVGQWTPTLIHETLRHRTVFPLVFPCCLTSITWVNPFEFRCYHVYELRFTSFSINFRLMAAIFDFQHTQTSDSNPICLSVLPDPEVIRIAIGNPLLSCIRAKINVFED